MAFEYGCFISHVSAEEPLMTEFLDSLVSALKSELEPYMDQPVFVDQERMRPGYRFNPALAHGLCASACWIPVYVPQFWKRDYCLRELKAMLDLESSRRNVLGDHLDPRISMIIPVILRGKREDLPAGLGDAVHCLTFDGFSTAEGDILRNSTYIAQVGEVAAYVNGIFGLGEELSCDCSQFAIPEAGKQLGTPPPPQPFPGHRRSGRGNPR